MRFNQTKNLLKALKLICLFCCLYVVPAIAENHIIAQTIEVQEDGVEMTPILDFKSTQAIKEAIDNGVRINVIAKAQLYTPKSWWFDTVKESKKIAIEIYYFKLGRLYVAKNLTNNEQISVNDYEEIWTKFEEIIRFKFLEPQLENSWIRSRLMLDTSALPTTMQLPVLFSNEWDVNTEWHSQKIIVEKKAQ
jgi:hypothetical protein